uniref:Uncharacterized protein n=1 Tax=Candidatus Kentrum sp. FW TaxID=2126338 RepID=A0A450TRA7_9GAMM|nr:MAG: hypothetical protein BECKFW1821C_GA0114237_102431 [Candidatus Kentron sp. FW]
MRDTAFSITKRVSVFTPFPSKITLSIKWAQYFRKSLHTVRSWTLTGYYVDFRSINMTKGFELTVYCFHYVSSQHVDTQ